MLIMKLGNAIYSDKDNKNCPIGILHSNSWPPSKERSVASFENGVRHIMVATSALSMGINYPDIHYITNSLLGSSKNHPGSATGNGER